MVCKWLWSVVKAGLHQFYMKSAYQLSDNVSCSTVWLWRQGLYCVLNGWYENFLKCTQWSFFLNSLFARTNCRNKALRGVHRTCMWVYYLWCTTEVTIWLWSNTSPYARQWCWSKLVSPSSMIMGYQTLLQQPVCAWYWNLCALVLGHFAYQ